MNESEHASYYEIALTSRQVLVVFVILLVCILASFFSGLWVGRGGTTAEASNPAEILAQRGGTLEPAAGTPGRADGLEAVSFFSEDEGPSEDEPIETRPTKPTPAKPAPKKAEPPPTPKPAPSKPAPSEAASAEPVATSPIPRASARRPATASTSELYVQVFSSRDEAQARKVLRRLQDHGYGAFLSPVEVESQTMYRVRIGPFGDRPAADDVAKKVRQGFKLETWITSQS